MAIGCSEPVSRSWAAQTCFNSGGGSRFEPTEVRIGPQDGDSTAIIEGVLEGQQVVASGQFLIDSEASLRGVETRMGPAAAQPQSNHAAEDTP